MQYPPFRLDTLAFQFHDQLASQPIQFTHGQNDFTDEFVLQFTKLERRAAKTTKLLTQSLLCERLLLSGDKRHGRCELCGVAKFVARDERQRLAGHPVDFEMQ